MNELSTLTPLVEEFQVVIQKLMAYIIHCVISPYMHKCILWVIPDLDG